MTEKFFDNRIERKDEPRVPRKRGRPRMESIRVRVFVGGQRISKNIPANTPKREIEAIRTKMKLEILNPKEIKVQIPTFKKHADSWLERADCGFSTKVKATQILKAHLYPTIGRLKLDQITFKILDDLRINLSKKLAPQSVGNIISVASNVFKDAMLHGYIQVNPSAGIKRVKKRRDVQDEEILCWSLSERDRFLGYVRDVNWKVFQVVAFTLFTGLRPNEVRGLLGDCLDWNTSTVTVKRQWCTKQNKLVNYTKGRRNRTVPIPRVVLELLKDRPHGPTDQVFGELTSNYGYTILRPLMKAAGMQVVKFHGLRHTFASHLYEVTKDVLLVRDILGHTNVATTNRYLHRLNNKVSGSTDGLLGGASFLNQPAAVVSIRR